MKMLSSSRGLFTMGFVLLVATNILVLYGVASNRSGTPVTQITLTERELQMPYRVQEENSGLTLRLVWRALGKEEDYNPYWRSFSPAWFDAHKLEELGFEIDKNRCLNDDVTSYKEPIPKEVFIVLENDGEPYRQAVKRAGMALEKEEALLKLSSKNEKLRENFENAEKRLKDESITASRLFAIDAGLDLKRIKEKYGDRTRFIITKGLVRPNYYCDEKRKEVLGYISELSTESIHVPLKHRKVFDNILAREKQKKIEFQPPRYEVELAYGSRLEPWIVSVHPLEDKSNKKIENNKQLKKD